MTINNIFKSINLKDSESIFTKNIKEAKNVPHLSCMGNDTFLKNDEELTQLPKKALKVKNHNMEENLWYRNKEN